MGPPSNEGLLGLRGGRTGSKRPERHAQKSRRCHRKPETDRRSTNDKEVVHGTPAGSKKPRCIVEHDQPGSTEAPHGVIWTLGEAPQRQAGRLSNLPLGNQYIRGVSLKFSLPAGGIE